MTEGYIIPLLFLFGNAEYLFITTPADLSFFVKALIVYFKRLFCSYVLSYQTFT